MPRTSWPLPGLLAALSPHFLPFFAFTFCSLGQPCLCRCHPTFSLRDDCYIPGGRGGRPNHEKGNGRPADVPYKVDLASIAIE